MTNFGAYITYMRTSCTSQDPFKWGGFLEILAASIMYRRPVHVHVMDIKPEHIICYDNAVINNDPLLLSYEGRNHHNALIPPEHHFLESRPGAEELLTLNAAALRKVRKVRGVPTRIVTNLELDAALENKKTMLANRRGN